MMDVEDDHNHMCAAAYVTGRCFGPAFLTRSYTQRRVMDHGMRHGMHL